MGQWTRASDSGGIDGSEIVHVQEEPVRNLLQAGIAKRSENGCSYCEDVKRRLGGVDPNGAQWRAESSPTLRQARHDHGFVQEEIIRSLAVTILQKECLDSP